MKDWRPIDTYKKGKALFFYPAIYKERKGKLVISNSELITTDLSYSRKPSHWQPLPPPPNLEDGKKPIEPK